MKNKRDNPVLEKSFAFALRIVKLCRYLVEEKKEFVMSRELLIAGTNVGKHIKEAVDAESREIFISEMGIARRKTSETEFWLNLLQKADFLSDKEFNSIEADRNEIFSLLTTILKTSKQNV